jgi:plasmid stabilization system protein ParE
MAAIIKWNRRALEQFEDAVSYIEDDSVSNAEKFKLDILTKIDSLSAYPEKYSPDKYKMNNDGTFRAFELHRYRVSYRFKRNEIRIIRVRHTKRNPRNY